MADALWYTVVKGDSLWTIAKKFPSELNITDTSDDGQILTAVNKLASLNNITNKNFITIGQKIKITGTRTAETNNSNVAKIKAFGLRSDTDNMLYATWTWTKSHTDHYEVEWYIDTGDGHWFQSSTDSPKIKEASFSIPNPDKVKRVRFRVKPISHTRDNVSGTMPESGSVKTEYYWTAQWTSWKTFNTKDLPPETPSGLKVEITNLTLKATLDNIESGVTEIQFQVVHNNKTVYKTASVSVTKQHAEWSCTVKANTQYKVRCRAVKYDSEGSSIYSEWSDYSDNQGTIPSTPSGLTVKARSKDSVTLSWKKSSTADTYTVEYTDDKTLFGVSDAPSKKTTDDNSTTFVVTGLDTGKEWFFRVRADNEGGSSGWSGIKSVIIGIKPNAPTTWSSTNTVIVGETVNLYWTHNSEDGSEPTFSKIFVNGVELTTITHEQSDDNDEDETTMYSHTLDTSQYSDGTRLSWYVQTRGVTDDYSEPSISREIAIYSLPDLTLQLTDAEDNTVNASNVLTSYPIKVSGTVPVNDYQWPVSYYLTVTSNSRYESVDDLGNVKMVNENDVLFSKYFDITGNLNAEISAGDVILDNSYNYTVTCVVSMSSGLTATESVTFETAWSDEAIDPNAYLKFDATAVTMNIAPYQSYFTEEGDEIFVENAVLSVYRREYDGSFTEICTGLENTGYSFCTDPHPALDYARYRIVAQNTTTGVISYADIALYIGIKCAIIQWDEAWSSYSNSNLHDETIGDLELEEPAWAGSMLKLHYNIDVSDNHDPDVELVEYVGRKRPVSYYGTHIGEKQSWSVEIPKDDKETLYALRRLVTWMGDVYVREPSGSGFWANINVSFSQTHCEVTIPVSIEIVRVEGGM